MTSAVLNETRHTAGFLVSKANGTRSVENMKMTNGGGSPTVYPAGTVVSGGLLAAAAPTFAGAGNGTLTAVSLGPLAIPGTYTVVATSATKFTVTDPQNDRLGDATASGGGGTAYTSGQLNFTLTTGGTAFVAGDTFSLVVAAGTGVVTPWVVGGAATGILYNEVFLNAGETRPVTVVRRSAEVNLSELVWPTGSTAPQQAVAIAQLSAFGIHGR